MTDDRPAPGIPCPRCGGRRWRTACTRPTPDGRVRRYKRCRACGHHLVTYEGTISRLPKVT